MRHSENGDLRVNPRQIGLERSAQETGLGFVRAHGPEGSSLLGPRSARSTAADERHVADVDFEAVCRAKRIGHRDRASLADLPARATGRAVQVPVLGRRHDVELLVPIGGVAVSDEAQFLEHVEGPMHGRWDGRGVARTALLDQLCRGDVAVPFREHLNHGGALWSPAQATAAQPLAEAAPRLGM